MCENTEIAEDDLVPSQVRDSFGRSLWFDILKANDDFLMYYLYR